MSPADPSPAPEGSASARLVVVPAHDEEATIREVVTRALRYADVSVTDDGSRDRTAEILCDIVEECRRGLHPHALHVITHPQATHIPRAIQDGLKFAVTRPYEWVVTMDAGLSHDPDALPAFFAADEGLDVVIGSRRTSARIPFYRKAITRGASVVVNYALTGSYLRTFRPPIRDCTSGYRRYSRRAAERIAGTALASRAFDFHMEALALCVRSGMSVAEIPIHYVFSNSSFNARVLGQAMRFAGHLLWTKSEAGKVVDASRPHVPDQHP